MNNCNVSEELLTHSKQKLRPTENKRQSAKKTLLDFTLYTRPDYHKNWHHETLAKMLDRVAAGTCRRLMVFLPPQHGKSELLSRRFPAYMLGKNPDLRLIAASHTHELAVAMNRDVQRIMDHNFKADSPGCRLLVDQLMDFPLAAHDDGPDALEMCTRMPVEVKRLR